MCDYNEISTNIHIFYYLGYRYFSNSTYMSHSDFKSGWYFSEKLKDGNTLSLIAIGIGNSRIPIKAYENGKIKKCTSFPTFLTITSSTALRMAPQNTIKKKIELVELCCSIENKKLGLTIKIAPIKQDIKQT